MTTLPEALRLAEEWLARVDAFGQSPNDQLGPLDVERVCRALLAIAPLVEAVEWWREHADSDYCDWLARTPMDLLAPSLRPEKRIVDALDTLKEQKP